MSAMNQSIESINKDEISSIVECLEDHKKRYAVEIRFASRDFKNELKSLDTMIDDYQAKIKQLANSEKVEEKSTWSSINLLKQAIINSYRDVQLVLEQ